MEVITTFSSKEAGGLSGLSLHMLAYLVRHNVVAPSDSPMGKQGRRRRYTLGDVIALKTISRLLDNGVRIKAVKESMALILSECANLKNKSDALRLLCTDGVSVYVKSSEEVLSDIRSGQYAFAFLIDLRSVHTELLQSSDNRLAEKVRTASR